MKRYVARLTGMEKLMAKFVERMRLLEKVRFEVKWEFVMEVGPEV